MAPQSTVDNEKLIELVRRNTCIYDHAHPQHKDVIKIADVWASIAAVMEKGNDWKSRWRYLRDNFVKKRKEMKTAENGQCAKPSKKWQFYDQMSFLSSYLKENRSIIFTSHSTETNVPPIESSEASDTEYTDSLISIKEEDGISERSNGMFFNPNTPSYTPIPTSAPMTPNLNRKRRYEEEETCNMGRVWTSFIEDSHKRRVEQRNVERSAEDLLFENYAIRMKRLPKATQSLVQLQLSQIFFNAENPDIPDIPVTTLRHDNTVHQQHGTMYDQQHSQYETGELTETKNNAIN
ncbi:uncharacterized protein LOC121381391 isoform X2 [Gigantopelta aegis]|uniref:uncharacterized protein LOC121381391 isoform X2 n=1 Tax=Gigantopelta aegis TaxID=1735272 RepID=UPI001B88B63A|nr:uncharacterized protein LOC121381391 isoform X2 [Gigantopelta aegis]